MSKNLVLKALNLLQDDSTEKPQKANSQSSKKQKKKTNKSKLLENPGTKVYCKPQDRIANNVKILKQLQSQLKPKSSVAQKVVELYTKSSSEDHSEKVEPQRSILFDDEDDDEKVKKKRKKRKYNSDDDDDF